MRFNKKKDRDKKLKIIREALAGKLPKRPKIHGVIIYDNEKDTYQIGDQWISKAEFDQMIAEDKDEEEITGMTIGDSSPRKIFLFPAQDCDPLPDPKEYAALHKHSGPVQRVVQAVKDFVAPHTHKEPKEKKEPVKTAPIAPQEPAIWEEKTWTAGEFSFSTGNPDEYARIREQLGMFAKQRLG